MINRIDNNIIKIVKITHKIINNDLKTDMIILRTDIIIPKTDMITLKILNKIPKTDMRTLKIINKEIDLKNLTKDKNQ